MREREALRRSDDQGGFSLVELMAATAIFALVFAAVSLGIGRALEVNRNNRNRSVAAYLAAKGLEEARAAAFDDVTLGRTTCVYSSPGPGCNVAAPYTVTQDVTWTAPGSTTSSCNVPSGGGAALAYKRVTVTVTWPNMRGVAPVTSQTLLTPPGGTFDPDEGHVLVRLFDRNAAPLAGQTVTLSGPETATQPTTAEGCVFFAYLDPGTYTVTLNTTGYVDRQGNQPAVQTVDVEESQISELLFDYDRAATLSLSLVTPSGSPTAAIPAGIPLTVANSNLTVGTKTFQEASTGSGVTRSVTPLFPYPSGYQVWAGSCADADPGSYSGGSRGAALASNPGATTSGSVALDAVDVIVRRGSTTGSLVGNALVGGYHASGTGCTTGLALTSATRTDANGQLRLALPYGSWTIYANGGNGYGFSAPPQVVLDPVASAIQRVTVVVP
jgi:prepilin-type N-terminal cleavage/methylation domain-containing protein